MKTARTNKQTMKTTTSMKTMRINKTSLKARGWTDSLINKYLPQPDERVLNPRYKSAPAMLLYSLDRVQLIEESDNFKRDLQKAERRKLSASKAVETKRNVLLNDIQLMSIELPVYDKQTLYKYAVNHYNSRRKEAYSYYDYEPASMDADELFLNRITVNYLRHELTGYEVYLASMYGCVGKKNGIDLVRKKVYEKISDTYPFLKTECEDQLKKRMYYIE